MSGITTLNVAGTQTISTSGSYLLNIDAAATVDIEGTSGTPVTATVAENVAVNLLDTTNIAYADEVLTSIGGVSAASTTNLGIDGIGNTVGNGTIEFGSGLGIGALSSLNLYGPNDEIILDTGVSVGLLDNLNGFASGRHDRTQGRDGHFRDLLAELCSWPWPCAFGRRDRYTL